MKRVDFASPPLFHFKYGKEKLRLKWLTYGNGRPAIIIETMTGQLYTKLTVNISEIPLGKNEYIIKDYSENVEVARVVYSQGWFTDTGLRFKSDFVVMPIWKLNE